MKKTKKSSNTVTRIISIAITFALVLCAVLSFGFIYIPQGALAAGEDTPTVTTQENVNGIRFVQVAAGEDFAIGLTFDGDLYGWSLLPETGSGKHAGNNSYVAISTTITLGQYYSTTPTKINVKFIQGPSASNANEWNQAGYNGSTTDKIKEIAATRTTAAFVTDSGYIYTWGNDTISEGVPIGNEANDHYLLLRTASSDYRWCEPYMINYTAKYGGSLDSDIAISNGINPVYGASGNAFDKNSVSIAAGEYNYTFLYARGGRYYIYTWGSLMYSVPNTEVNEGDDNLGEYDYSEVRGGDVRFPFDTGRDYTVGTNNVSVVAGGYNVGLNSDSRGNGSTSLQLRGKNVLTSTGSQNNIVYTTETSNGGVSKIANTSAVSGIIGGKQAKFEVDSNTVSGLRIYQGSVTYNVSNSYDKLDTADNYYGRQASNNVNTTIDYRQTREAAINGAHNNELSGCTVRLYGVSLGNDVGYGVDTAGKLYAWGDNSVGQLTNAVNGADSTPANLSKPTQINATGSAIANKVFNTVAAGKQLSGSEKAFHSANTFDEDGQFTDDVKNDVAYISGAIADGALYVWSDKDRTPREIKYGYYDPDDAEDIPQDGDKFLAVYSGYGNYLFAITKLGKLVRITYSVSTGEGEEGAATEPTVTYNQYRYDTFRQFKIDANGTVITENGVAQTELIENWKVNSGNVVHFTNTDATHSQYATFYVWESANLDTTSFATSTYNPLVSLNNIGDAYRILGGNDKDESRRFLDGTSKPTDIDDNYFAPVYKYDGVVMNEKQRDNMFRAEIVNDANGVGIKITPKQSSKGKTITVEFFIARYANTLDVTAAGNILTDNAQYYDYKPCTISFDIADTATTLAYRKYEGGVASTDTNSLIPLLDPNNDYNNTYSVAVQDVSGGVRALFNHFNNTAEDANNTRRNQFELGIAGIMSQQDAGYPLNSKVGDGNLNYYLGEAKAATYYNNRYQFLYSDIDADIIRITKPATMLNPLSGGVTSSITPDIINVTVSFDLATYFPGISANSTLITQFKKDFNNLYGFYNIYFGANPDDDSAAEKAKTATTITFTYDIVRFTATAGTGNIAYSAESKAVSSYVTTAQSSGVQASVSATVQTYDFNTGEFVTLRRGEQPLALGLDETANIIAVHAMASLRMKKEFNDGAQITGQQTDAKTNVYKEVYDSEIRVGQSVTIHLKDYFENLGNTGSGANQIKFSFNDKYLQSDYDDFDSQFIDETGNGVKIVKLSADEIKVEPTTTANIQFTVAIQRFTNSNVAFAGGNEKIYATFIFNNIKDFVFAKTDEIDPTYDITKQETITLFGDEGSRNAGDPLVVLTCTTDSREKLMNAVRISEPTSSENVNDSNRLFDISNTATSFTITPRRSGSGTVQFIASVYGQNLLFTININVSKVILMDDVITMVDDSQYVYIETFTNKIKQTHSFDRYKDDYDIIYTDIEDTSASQLERKYNAIYFTATPDGEALTDPPSFIKNAVIQGVDLDGKPTEEKPSIRIVSNNTSTDTSSTYYMHVKFINMRAAGVSSSTTYATAPDGSVIEAIIAIKSGKVVVNAYSVDIDCKAPKSSEGRYTVSGSGVDTKVEVRISGLLESAGYENSTLYTISLVTADPSVSEYLNYSAGADKKSVEITPLYNTPDEGCVISVSAKYSSNSIVLMFYVNIDGITTVLPVMTDENGVIGYGNIWLYSFLIVFGVLAVIFVIRMIVYWKKRAKQRALIKRNQELIRLRDRMHNKASMATKEQIVKTKLKMDDPKYAKMFNDMRKNKEEESGVILENSELAATADAKVKKNKKKKGGKKSVAELKAELEAKKAAFAAAQAQGAQPVNPFAADVPPMDGGGDFAQPADDFGGAQSIDGSDIVFDASDMGEGM